MDQSHDCRRAIELGPELELRVRGADGVVAQRRRVRERLTLGRAAASDLVIDDPDANLIHARVVTASQGLWELVSVGRARMGLVDGGVGDRIELAPGVTFSIGHAKVECERLGSVDNVVKYASPVRAWGDGNVTGLMSKAKSAAADAAAVPDGQWEVIEDGEGAWEVLDEPAALGDVRMPRLVVCPACYRDMTAVPVAARFCPKCGARLPARDAAGYLIPPEESSPLYPVYQALRDELEHKLADETPQVASSLIILAYANALLNLGWRYENGRGGLRNVAEASRCYEKAGRLSEAWGRGRA